MRLRLISCFFLLMIWSFQVNAIAPTLADPKAHPPRTIRVCCFFGSKVGIAVVPFIKLTEVTSIDKIGSHHFLGKLSENNGVIYTKRGGFIDMGHVRDQADWTAYLYALIQQEKNLDCIQIDLGYEGGEKKLSISVPAGLSDQDILLLAGRIAYDLSLWHEIATWFGVCSVPLISEQFSSFSVEDGYSNLLGVFLGMKAVQSTFPYEVAMTLIIREKLNELNVVKTEAETLQAMEAVRDLWWTRDVHLPDNRQMMVRQTVLYDTIHPMLIPRVELMVRHPEALIVPSVTSSGDSLTNFYELSIRLNYKFPVKELFHDSANKNITQKQFGIMVKEIDKELQTGFLTKSKAEMGSIRKTEKSDHKKNRETGQISKPENTHNL
jgi:hypothetical protein